MRPCSSRCRTLWPCVGAALTALLPALAWANFPPIAKAAADPTEVLLGQPVSFSSAGTIDPDRGPQPLSYLWDFGDGNQSTLTDPVHAFDSLGLQVVTLTVSDGDDQSLVAVEVVVVEPPTATPPSRSSALALRSDDGELWVVNPDSDSISRIELGGEPVVTELEVCDDPRTLAYAAGETTLLVACHGSDELVVIDAATATVLDAIPLGRAPFGVAVVPGGARFDHVLVSHEGDGSVWLLDPSLVAIEVLELGGSPRPLAIESDGSRAFVGQFLTSGEAGTVVAIELDTLTTSPIELVEDPGPDSSTSGRGFPNLIGGLTIDPSGRDLWIGAHKANTGRGEFVNGEPLQPRNRIRGLLARVALDGGELAEDPSDRIDTNDADNVAAIAFSPLGRYAYLTHRGAGRLTVYDLPAVALLDLSDDAAVPFTARVDLDDLPTAVVVSSDGALAYASNELGRSVSVLDLSDPAVPELVDTITVTTEPLTAEVALGKRLFNRSREPIHSDQNYIACAGCHPDGGHDGRTWDFTQFGEGLRNTIDLRGHGGLDHGPVHWTANFDEIQDFENDIVNGFGGEGLAQDGLAPHPPLSAMHNAGRSVELDALAAYVSSLNQPPRSPHREPDRSLGPAAARGRELFYDDALGCAECHAPPLFTDSILTPDPADFVLHDVGSFGEGSGQRIGGPLTGLDTPSLLGLWASAPYLHDGSATLREVLTERNVDDRHGHTSQLSEGQIDDLIAFLLALDGSPDELPDDGDETGETGESSETGESGESETTTESGETGPAIADSGSGCACRSSAPNRRPALLALLFALLLRRRNHPRKL